MTTATVDIPVATETLEDLIRRISKLNPENSDWQIAEEVLAEIETPPSANLLMTLPAVSHYARVVRRQPVRAREHDLTRSWRPSASIKERETAARDETERLQLYASEYVMIPGKRGKVRAGTVIIGDWKKRIEMIQKDIDRETGTVRFITHMVDLLQTAKVSTLDEYLERG